MKYEGFVEVDVSLVQRRIQFRRGPLLNSLFLSPQFSHRFQPDNIQKPFQNHHFSFVLQYRTVVNCNLTKRIEVITCIFQ